MFDTKVYFKPANKFSYLPPTSNHSPAQNKAGIKGEAIRAYRISSDKGSWLEALHKIFNGLRARGYSPIHMEQE